MDSLSQNAIAENLGCPSDLKNFERLEEKGYYGGRKYTTDDVAKGELGEQKLNFFQSLRSRCSDASSRALSSPRSVCDTLKDGIQVSEMPAGPGLAEETLVKSSSGEPPSDLQQVSLASVSRNDLMGLGLKLNRGSDECPIPDSLEGWEKLAAFNRYGIIPEETIRQCPKFEDVARHYNSVAMRKRGEWLKAHPGYMGFEKTSKLGLSKIRLYSQEGLVLGSGASKRVIRSDVLNPSILGTDKKEKAIASQLSTGTDDKVQKEFQREQEVITALKKAGVRHIVHLAQHKQIDSSQSILEMDEYKEGSSENFFKGFADTTQEQEKLNTIASEIMEIKSRLKRAQGQEKFAVEKQLEEARQRYQEGNQRMSEVSRQCLISKRRVLIEVAEGLADMHRAGYVHGDFKFANVLLGQNRGSSESGEGPIVHPFLTDFGLSRPIGDEFPVKCGTYVAPEVEVTDCTTVPALPAMDVYAFGCELRGMISPSDLEAFNETEEGQFINKLVSDNPHDRPSADELVQFLRTHDLPFTV